MQWDNFAPLGIVLQNGVFERGARFRSGRSQQIRPTFQNAGYLTPGAGGFTAVNIARCIKGGRHAQFRGYFLKGTQKFTILTDGGFAPMS
jgi:hypothetical protein